MSTIVTLKKYSNRFREEYQRRGLTELGSLIFSHLARKSYTTNSSCWFHLSLHDPLTAVKPKVPAQFGFMQFEEAINFFREKSKRFPWMYQENEIQVAAECGHRFPCYSMDGQVVAYLKVGITKAYIFDFEQVVYLSPGTATFYDGFVAPEFRCQGLGSAILSSTAQFLQHEGFETILNQVPLWNTPSRKMCLIAGFTEVSQTRFIRLFEKQIIWNNPKTFPLHFELNRRKEKVLRLDDFRS
jgi:ribosomal protein S18 acetylase RimI-like enzyme